MSCKINARGFLMLLLNHKQQKHQKAQACLPACPGPPGREGVHLSVRGPDLIHEDDMGVAQTHVA